MISSTSHQTLPRSEAGPHRVQYFLKDLVASGAATFPDLYITSQQPGRVLPRMYLMVTTACCAMEADPAAVSHYLGDLLDFVRGIQHPMRGLFLRSFLNTSVRGLLPDTSGARLGPSLPAHTSGARLGPSLPALAPEHTRPSVTCCRTRLVNT